MSTAETQRRIVISLYKQIIKLGKNWQAKDASQTAVERQTILAEARERFRQNKNETDPAKISELIIQGQKRLVQAEHYGIPYERLEYLPPNTAYNVVSAQNRYSKLNRSSRRFCLSYYSGTKISPELLKDVVKSPEFPHVCDVVINNAVFQKYSLRNSYRRAILKEISSIMGDDTPDIVYDSLAECVVDQADFSYRLFVDEAGCLLCALREMNQQLCYGTTGLSIWQASCDLAHLISLVNLDGKHILELGAGCGLAGISAAASSATSRVLLTDYNPKVLSQLRLNVDENFGEAHRVSVSCLDWSTFDVSQIDILPDVVIASDVVYDRALLPSLCSVIHSLLSSKQDSFALIASTLRDPDTLKAFRREIESHGLVVKGEANYYRGVYEFPNKSTVRSDTRFPFFSTLDTPTIVYYLCLQ